MSVVWAGGRYVWHWHWSNLDLLDWIYSQEIYYFLCFPLQDSHPFSHSGGYPWSFFPRWELTGCYIWKHEVWQSLWRAKTQRHPSADFSWAQVHPQCWHGAPGHQTESVCSPLPLQPYLVLSSLLSESVPICLSVSKMLFAGRVIFFHLFPLNKFS